MKRFKTQLFYGLFATIMLLVSESCGQKKRDLRGASSTIGTFYLTPDDRYTEVAVGYERIRELQKSGDFNNTITAVAGFIGQDTLYVFQGELIRSGITDAEVYNYALTKAEIDSVFKDSLYLSSKPMSMLHELPDIEIDHDGSIEKEHVGWRLVHDEHYDEDGFLVMVGFREIYYEPAVRAGKVSYLNIFWADVHNQLYSDTGVHEDPSLYVGVSQLERFGINDKVIRFEKIYLDE